MPRAAPVFRAPGSRTEAQRKADAERYRGSSQERGYTAAWRRAAKVYLQDHPLCAECKRNGWAEAATCVDHIVPHRGDGHRFWDVSNWQPLCASCHASKTAREDGGFGNAAPTARPRPK